ncbi:MAG: DMT family transporter [Alphaproteobacteria bacterium]|nr:DMT family transporter [Alphaproteobacteria bacterium]NNF23379.1 DMT family transporter [Paracoccaceae bacterium]
MNAKSSIDAFGAVSLILFAALMGFNQVVIRVVNDGLQPVFFAGLRSAGAVFCVGLWMWARGIRMRPMPGTWGVGIAVGLLFSAEFVFLFLALDLTTVSRTAVIFYSMPIWMALGAHFFIDGERMTRLKAAGQALAFSGVALAILDRPDSGAASLAGDVCALGAAIGWAGSALMVRATALREESPEMQHMWQISVSAAVLLILAPLFGPLIRDLQPIHLWGLAFQIVIVVSTSFIFWLWLLSIYPPSSVAAFGFLGPIFGVLMGWLLLDEDVSIRIWGSLALVALGLALINRPVRRAV